MINLAGPTNHAPHTQKIHLSSIFLAAHKGFPSGGPSNGLGLVKRVPASPKSQRTSTSPRITDRLATLPREESGLAPSGLWIRRLLYRLPLAWRIPSWSYPFFAVPQGLLPLPPSKKSLTQAPFSFLPQPQNDPFLCHNQNPVNSTLVSLLPSKIPIQNIFKLLLEPALWAEHKGPLSFSQEVRYSSKSSLSE